MEIRELNNDDTASFYECLKGLDLETKFMMFEPDERKWNENLIEALSGNGENLLLGVFTDEKIIGFLSAKMGAYRRIRHIAYIVIGIRKDYHHRGIGTKLFKALDIWSDKNNITRLELTVEVPNTNAIGLYKKSGFSIEGIKKNAMLVDGRYVDEYMMAKIIVE